MDNWRFEYRARAPSELRLNSPTSIESMAAPQMSGGLGAAEMRATLAALGGVCLLSMADRQIQQRPPDKRFTTRSKRRTPLPKSPNARNCRISSPMILAIMGRGIELLPFGLALRFERPSHARCWHTNRLRTSHVSYLLRASNSYFYYCSGHQPPKMEGWSLGEGYYTDPAYGLQCTEVAGGHISDPMSVRTA